MSVTELNATKPTTTKSNKVRLKSFYGEDATEIQIGCDEAGRGSFAGSVFAAAVVWNPELNDPEVNEIRDSKKLSKKKRYALRKYIESNAIAFSVQSCDNCIIDEINILQATYKAMHSCLKNIYDTGIKVDRILVDGEHFLPFACQAHNCIPKGDDVYISIAAASILAKTYHDDWILEKCAAHPELDEKYKWSKNMGYGTKEHRDGLIQHGITEFHRKTFCRKYI